MKKVVFYLPAIIFIAFLGAIAINHIGSISAIAFVWFVMFLLSGILLSKNRFWGGFLGTFPAMHLIYMGTQDTGQMMNETPIGIFVLIFYLVCASIVFYKNRKG